jgi:hypothetical protein
MTIKNRCSIDTSVSSEKFDAYPFYYVHLECYAAS